MFLSIVLLVQLIDMLFFLQLLHKLFILNNMPYDVAYVSVINTHYHNSNLNWRTVSCRVDEGIPLVHPRRIASRVIQWYGHIHET